MKSLFWLMTVVVCFSCGKGGDDSPTPPPPPPATTLTVQELRLENVAVSNGETKRGIRNRPAILVRFNKRVTATSALNMSITTPNGVSVARTATLTNGDSSVIVQPTLFLTHLQKYIFTVPTTVQAADGTTLTTTSSFNFFTGIDSSRKFPALSDNALLDLVQQQTFKYFWDFGHPISGLARERNSSGDVCASGGSGFGIMTLPVAINRGFITRAQGLARLQTIVAFLKNTAVKVKGAFPHWINGANGAIVPFSANDNGADLVETSYLMMGLLTARQYFNGGDAAEATLRADINSIYNNVEWDWFRNGGQNVLYWHYSNDKGWIMNLPIRGWNECLITYVMAASSTTHGVPPIVYTSGWKGSTSFVNGNTYLGYQLPLGPAQGGPLFFSHYSFMGINPNGLNDSSANYATQTKNHTLINYSYSRANPQGWYGYSDSVWGLTASDIENGYTASSPTNDVSVIAPTAALSSFPYTPAESMAALKFFYYVLGDKLWKEFGFIDAFSLHNTWFASSFLAIDQGPIIVMIENYRTGLLWNLFTSCPEVKAGMQTLGFTAPYL